MRKLLTAMAAASAVAVSLPAMAQSYTDRAQTIEERIDSGVSDGSLTRREARDLRTRLYNLEQMDAQYDRENVTGWRARDLEQRFNNLSDDVLSERHDNGYRSERRIDPY